MLSRTYFSTTEQWHLLVMDYMLQQWRCSEVVDCLCCSFSSVLFRCLLRVIWIKKAASTVIKETSTRLQSCSHHWDFHDYHRRDKNIKYGIRISESKSPTRNSPEPSFVGRKERLDFWRNDKSRLVAFAKDVVTSQASESQIYMQAYRVASDSWSSELWCLKKASLLPLVPRPVSLQCTVCLSLSVNQRLMSHRLLDSQSLRASVCLTPVSVPLSPCHQSF